MLKIIILEKGTDYIIINVFPECIDDGNDFTLKINLREWEIVYPHAREEQRIYERQAITALKSELKRNGLEKLPSDFVSEWY